MSDPTGTSDLSAVLGELGWKSETLARRLNSFAALQGRAERVLIGDFAPYRRRPAVCRLTDQVAELRPT